MKRAVLKWVALMSAAALPVFASKIIVASLPSVVEVCVGRDTTLCIVAQPLLVGDQLRYQWYRDGQLLSGETGPCLTIRNPQLSDDWAIYEVRVESYYVDQQGQVRVNGSESSTMTVRVSPPVQITAQPQNWTGCEGQQLNLNIGYTGGAIGFQWYHNGAEVPGANSETFSKIATVADSGTWWCVVKSPCGDVVSNQVQVRVLELPRISRQPSSVAECLGRQVTLSVEAAGSLPFTYQWYRNNIPVGTGSSYTFTVDQNTEGEYWVVVSNTCGNVTSRRVQVVAYRAPQIIAQPQGGQFSQGSRIVLRVEATGKLPLTYRWQRNGVDLQDGGGITGSQTSTLTIFPADSAAHGGRYRCKVSNDCGEVWSSEAEVEITVVGVQQDITAGGYRLWQAEPTPAAEQAWVRLQTPGTERVVVRLYDAYGRERALLFEGLLGAGEHRIPVDVLQLGLSPGVYMVRLESPSVMLYRPLVVVR